jgi:hypothetical protein
MNNRESSRIGRDKVSAPFAGDGNGSNPRTGDRNKKSELEAPRSHHGMLRPDADHKRRDRDLLIVGSIAVGLWFIVFGCGTLISSRDYRLVTDTDFCASWSAQ